MDRSFIIAVENSSDFEQLKAAIKRKIKYLRYDADGAAAFLLELVALVVPSIEQYVAAHDRVAARLSDQDRIGDTDIGTVLNELERAAEKLHKYLDALSLVREQHPSIHPTNHPSIHPTISRCCIDTWCCWCRLSCTIPTKSANHIQPPSLLD
jgi:hypothetical protein